MPPQLNEKRAQFVIAKIDQILGWERQTDRERDTRFVELGRYLCEVRAGQYWRLENLASFDDYLMSIHENLPKPIRRELKQVGWSKAAELAKVARRDGEQFKSADWLHKAQSMPHQQFRDEVDKYLTGQSEPSELIYFKVYKSQVSVIEQALEIAARMLGSDRSRGYCLEIICADFLAGANLENDDADVLLNSLRHWFGLLTFSQQERFLHEIRQSA